MLIIAPSATACGLQRTGPPTLRGADELSDVQEQYVMFLETKTEQVGLLLKKTNECLIEIANMLQHDR